MDAASERSFPYLLDEELVPCRLEEGGGRRRRFPRAEACVVSLAVGTMLATCGLVMIVLHYTLETPNSLLGRIASPPLLGLMLLLLAGLLPLCALLACAVWRALEVLDMAHRYREHLCAYEEMRQSMRSHRRFNPQDSK
ncbi:hypothetical protein AVEN_88003-1 [Araneus ventricosus]|uniref:Uncharacterized protein n=1 Tax=Araneus ventricosus TaxID=182803 RepID=A0A4Y2G107_ARAVE|nr:hypothetical protein AVEN_88003-1 [Araneus ventricosus]